MNDPGKACHPRSPWEPPPCRDLYIYYIRGKVKAERGTFGPAFLGNWQEDGFSFLFFSTPSEGRVRKFIQSQPQLTLVDNYHMSYDQWQGGGSHAFSVGRFFVTSPWQKAVAPSGSDVIVLDPGVVFGNGAHATTRSCLEALTFLAQRETPSTALDLGTGSGVLALAAAEAGCRNTVAVDSNFLAAETAYKNALLNGLEHRIHVVCGRAQDWIHHPADLLMANIHFDVMQALILSEGFYRKKWFILSGLLRSQADKVVENFCARPVQMIKKWTLDGIWYTFLGRIQ